jgi:phage terminase small subunit
MPNRPIPRNLRLIGPEGRGDTERPSAPRSGESQVPPPAPSWVNVEAAEHWNAIAEQMVAERIWRPCYERTLAIFCELLSVFLANPKVFGPSKLGQLRLLAGDLGLSPSHFHRVSRTAGR